jgi:NTE family protein
VQLWSNLKDSDIKKHWFIPYISAFWTGGIYNNQPLRDFLNKNLNVNNVKHSNRKLVIGAVCLNNGEYERFDENSDLIKAIMGSSALPLGFPPEVINGKQYLDGGLKTSDPINDAIDLGADIIDVVICCPEKTNKYSNSNNILTVGLRGFDIMNNEISEADLKIAELYNKLVLSGAKTDKRVVEINVIRPKEDLVGGGLDFIHSNIMTIMEQGYNQAKEVFQK